MPLPILKYLYCSLAVFALFLTGCKAMRLAKNEKVLARIACQELELAGNRLFIHTNLEGTDRTFVLDLGAGRSVIFDTTAIPGYSTRPKSTFGSAMGADRKTRIPVVHFAAQVRNDLQISGNKVFVHIANPMKSLDTCSRPPDFTGLYGMDFFERNQGPLMLDFGTMRACNLAKQELAPLLAGGYRELKCRYSIKGILVYITINGKEYPFKFDTGFSGSFTMPDRPDLPFRTEPHLTMEGMNSITAAGVLISTNQYYQGKAVGMGGREYPVLLTTSTGVKAQNMGMGFIKAFNWIFDLEKEKVYVKDLESRPDSSLKQPHLYYAASQNGKLVVSRRQAQAAEYAVGAEIASVNGQAVTPENRCALMRQLNQAEDWKALAVTVK